MMNTKLNKFLMVGFFILGSIMPTYAIDGPEGQTSDEPTFENHDYYGIGGDDSYPIFNTTPPENHVLTRRASVTEQAWAGDGITRFYQDDIPDSYKCIGGTPVKDVGCTITSYAMVLSKYGYYREPQYVFEDLKRTGGVGADCNMIWNPSAVSAAYPGIIMEHSYNDGLKESVAMQKIEGILKTGKPVIVGMHKLGDHDTHYVVCYGYEKYSDGGVFHYIFNPQKGRADTLEGYMANWYIETFTMLYR